MLYLGLGSNVGNRKENLYIAIKKIDAYFSVIDISSIYETKPWGCTNQNSFYNQCISVDVNNLKPLCILNILKLIESSMGRKKTKKWGPRLIDIDLLLFDGCIFNTERLKIPHPFLHERTFVLKPLSEIASELIHPIYKKSIVELLLEIENIEKTEYKKD